MMLFFGLFGTLFLLTLHLQFVLGYTPLEAGLRMLPVGVLKSLFHPCPRV